MSDQDVFRHVGDLNPSDVVECVVVFKDKTERRYQMSVSEVQLFQGMLQDEKNYGFVNIGLAAAQSVTIDTSEVLAVELGKKLHDWLQSLESEPKQVQS
jgi:hypothetical protein